MRKTLFEFAKKVPVGCKISEIGCFEGFSTSYIAKDLMENNDCSGEVFRNYR